MLSGLCQLQRDHLGGHRWDAIERYVYPPYGVLTIYDATWSNIRSASSYDVQYTHTGRRSDGETGLFDYRHRVYHVQLGRLCSRDLIAADPNLYRYVGNNPVIYDDPAGLRAIKFRVAAFIPGRLGTWLHEPGSASTYFKKDEREAGQPGTSRLMSEGTLESTKIGTASAGDVRVTTDTGYSHRKTYRVTNDTWDYDTAKATPHGPDPTVESTKMTMCWTDVTIETWASYPFLSPFSPSIYYKVTFTFFVVRKGTVGVLINATHSTFPDFEGGVDGQFPYVFHTTDSGPSFTDLWWNRTSRVVQTFVSAETDQCCP